MSEEINFINNLADYQFVKLSLKDSGPHVGLNAIISKSKNVVDCLVEMDRQYPTMSKLFVTKLTNAELSDYVLHLRTNENTKPLIEMLLMWYDNKKIIESLKLMEPEIVIHMIIDRKPKLLEYMFTQFSESNMITFVKQKCFKYFKPNDKDTFSDNPTYPINYRSLYCQLDKPSARSLIHLSIRHKYYKLTNLLLKYDLKIIEGIDYKFDFDLVSVHYMLKFGFSKIGLFFGYFTEKESSKMIDWLNDWSIRHKVTINVTWLLNNYIPIDVYESLLVQRALHSTPELMNDELADKLISN
jgi:hypothetical protein